jgi:hypothetical protein
MATMGQGDTLSTILYMIYSANWLIKNTRGRARGNRYYMLLTRGSTQNSKTSLRYLTVAPWELPNDLPPSNGLQLRIA